MYQNDASSSFCFINRCNNSQLDDEHEPTSALLSYCKRKFLRPYMLILSVVGVNPVSTDTSRCGFLLSYLQALLILALLLFGYALQYICGYRGDRGFAAQQKFVHTSPQYARVSTADVAYAEELHTIGELLFGYIVPNTLHLLGFLTAVVVCKMYDNEQLQNLIERVFLMTFKPKRLCRILWVYVSSSLLLVLLLFAYVMPAVSMQEPIIKLKWLSERIDNWNWNWSVKLCLLLSIFVQNLVEVVIVASYCIECYLLRVHLHTLSHKLLMHSIEALDWMREVLEFRKLLDHLNTRLAVPISFYTIMNLSYAFAGIVYLFKDFDFHYSALRVVILCIVNVLLWLLLGLLPFFLAASVTRACQAAQANGHQIRVRPFVYHNTSADDLNSTLLFASSLNMSAKLFRMPIQSNYLCFAILVISMIVLTLGMCLNLSALGSF